MKIELPTVQRENASVSRLAPSQKLIRILARPEKGPNLGKLAGSSAPHANPQPIVPVLSIVTRNLVRQRSQCYNSVYSRRPP